MIYRRTIALLACAAALAVASPARAYRVANPHEFVTGEKLTQTILNAPIDTLYSVLNGGIDASNVGPAGFYASQIVPTSGAQATFGGAVGYTFGSTGGVVPLTVAQAAGATSDIFDLTLGGSKVFYVDSAGTTHIGNAPTFSGIVSSGDIHADANNLYARELFMMGPSSTGTAAIAADNAPGAGINMICSATATYCLRLINSGNSVTEFQVDRSGNETLNGGLTAPGGAVFGGDVALSGHTLTAAQVNAANITLSGGLSAANLLTTNETITNALSAASATVGGVVAAGSVTAGPISGTSGTFSSVSSGGQPVVTAPSSGSRISTGVVAISLAGTCGASADCGLAVATAYRGGSFGGTPVCTLSAQTPLFMPSIVPTSTTASQLTIDATNVSNTAIGSATFNVDYVRAG